MESIVFFVAPFYAADVISNLSMVIIKVNSGQSVATFFVDTWKMTLYDINFWNRKNISECIAENGLDIGLLY